MDFENLLENLVCNPRIFLKSWQEITFLIPVLLNKVKVKVIC